MMLRSCMCCKWSPGTTWGCWINIACCSTKLIGLVQIQLPMHLMCLRFLDIHVQQNQTLQSLHHSSSAPSARSTFIHSQLFVGLLLLQPVTQLAFDPVVVVFSFVNLATIDLLGRGSHAPAAASTEAVASNVPVRNLTTGCCKTRRSLHSLLFNVMFSVF